MIFRWALWGAQWLSPVWVLRVCGLLAGLIAWFDGDAAKTTRTNLQVCFPDLSAAERALLCRSSLQHMLLLFFEFGQLTHWPLDRLLSQITEIHGKTLLDDATAECEEVDTMPGALLLVPHFGNWELLCAFLGVHYGFAALYDRPKLSALEPAILKARQRFAGQMFAIDAGGMRKLMQAMRQGTLTVLLPDQVPGRDQGVYAPFFEQPALTMTLAHKLAQRSGHRVLVATVQRVLNSRGYSYCLRVEQLPALPATLDPKEFAAVINQAIEQVVLRAPEQYQWEYKRFKRPPEAAAANIYLRQ